MIHLYKGDYLFEHKSSASSKENFINHIHTEWELYYLVDGKTDFCVNGSVYKLKPGDLLLIKSGTFHFASPDQNDVYERIVITFPEDHLLQFLDEQAEQSFYFYHLPENSSTISMLSCISKAVENFNQEEALSCIKKLLDVILLHLKYYHSSVHSPKPLIVNVSLENVLLYIEKNLNNNLTLENISKDCYLSTSWLTHIFKQSLNVTPKQYINYKKIINAQKMIRTGINPYEAFSLIGYNDYSTFFRQYKKILKRSPTDDYLNQK